MSIWYENTREKVLLRQGWKFCSECGNLINPQESDFCTRCRQSSTQQKRPVKAILSTTILPIDGTYKVETVELSEVEVAGVEHYIGHPATKAILEGLGAVPASSRLFEGQENGETVLTCAIKQGRSIRTDATQPHQEVTIEDIHFRVVKRLE